MNFKQSPVIFDEDSHTYYLGDKRLLGITGLIHSILGLGVYPDASDYIKDFVVPRAGSRGTAVHHAIQTYDQLGIKQTQQIVHTRFGCRERDNIQYEDLEWDVSYELECYIHNLIGCSPLANELTVSDNAKWASQIDNVWLNEQTGGIWLVDTKTNNIDLYPLCGYYKQNVFRTGEDALKEYLSWQLSIYAELFEAENPEYKVEGLACNWLRKNTSAFWLIERKPSELVRELLSTEYIFGDNGPVFFHHDLSIFGIGTPTEPTEEKTLLPEDVVAHIHKLLRQSKEIEQQLEDAKATLRTLMEQNDVKTFDFGSFGATLAADSVSTSFDSKQFKKDNPELYNQYVTQKPKKGGLTLKLKDK